MLRIRIKAEKAPVFRGCRSPVEAPLVLPRGTSKGSKKPFDPSSRGKRQQEGRHSEALNTPTTPPPINRGYCIIRHSLRCLRHSGVSFTRGRCYRPVLLDERSSSGRCHRPIVIGARSSIDRMRLLPGVKARHPIQVGRPLTLLPYLCACVATLFIRITIGKEASPQPFFACIHLLTRGVD